MPPADRRSYIPVGKSKRPRPESSRRGRLDDRGRQAFLAALEFLDRELELLDVYVGAFAV